MVHQRGRQLDRPDHHRRAGHQLHRPEHRPSPSAIAAGPDGALWFTNAGNNSIGRITTAGQVTSYTAVPTSDYPAGITAGPDGALWFTNDGNGTIGRITTTGQVTTYTGPGISGAGAITAGPGGALWFTNQSNNMIGRIIISTTSSVGSFASSSDVTATTTVTISRKNPVHRHHG